MKSLSTPGILENSWDEIDLRQAIWVLLFWTRTLLVQRTMQVLFPHHKQRLSSLEPNCEMGSFMMKFCGRVASGDCCSVAQSCPTLCSLLQHTRFPCPSPSPRACSNSCPLSQWCHPTILSSVIPFSSCLHSFPASFLMSWLFASGDQSIGASALALPMNIHSWFPFILIGLISLLYKGLSRVFSKEWSWETDLWKSKGVVGRVRRGTAVPLRMRPLLIVTGMLRLNSLLVTQIEAKEPEPLFPFVPSVSLNKAAIRCGLPLGRVCNFGQGSSLQLKAIPNEGCSSWCLIFPIVWKGHTGPDEEIGVEPCRISAKAQDVKSHCVCHDLTVLIPLL